MGPLRRISLMILPQVHLRNVLLAPGQFRGGPDYILSGRPLAAPTHFHLVCERSPRRAARGASLRIVHCTSPVAVTVPGVVTAGRWRISPSSLVHRGFRSFPQFESVAGGPTCTCGPPPLFRVAGAQLPARAAAFQGFRGEFGSLNLVTTFTSSK